MILAIQDANTLIDLHLFDLMLEEEVLTLKATSKAMERLMATNPRLPLDECHKRLRKWMAQAGG